MKLDWLREIIGEGYTEEMDEKVCQAIGKDYVPRADFNTKNEALKTALEAAKQFEGVNLDELKAGYEKQLSDLRLSSAIDLALANSKARNTKAVRALLDLNNVKLDDKGALTGLADQLSALQKSDGWLFDAGSVVDTGGEHGSGGDAGVDGVEAAFGKLNPGLKI